jgi:outer membrane immunogenic protein
LPVLATFADLLAAVAIPAAGFVGMTGANIAVAAELSQPAPLPVKAPAYVPPPFTWTGFYLGGNLGGAWAQHTVTEEFFGLSFDTGTRSGEFIGGQIGFNYEFGGGLVLGVESEIDGIANNSNSNGGVGVLVPALKDTVALTSNNKWIATIAARFGWAFDNWLLYGKAGGAWLGTHGFTIADLTTAESISTPDHTASGWLVGLGLEYFLNICNCTLKVEYDYLGLSNQRFVLPNIPTPTPFDAAFVGDTFTAHRNVQTVKVGFNYLFTWGGPARGY